MPGNWHVRFGGGPYGKGPANCGHLAVRPTQPWPTVGYAHSGIQVTRFGASSGGRLGDRVADHQADIARRISAPPSPSVT
jgi:hypothetical protein